MDNSTMLMISYENLKEMLEAMQEDGLSADGCRYDLHEDAAKYIAEEIADGNITTISEERPGYWKSIPSNMPATRRMSTSAFADERKWQFDIGGTWVEMDGGEQNAAD